MVDSVRVTLCITVVMFGLHVLAGVYAVSTAGWMQSKVSTSGAQQTRRLAPFYTCSSAVGSDTISCTDYESFEVIDGDCKVTKTTNGNYMKLIQAFAITPGGLSAVGGVVALIGLSLSTLQVAMRIIPSLVFAILALLTNAAGIAITITSVDSIFCGKGLCIGQTDCKNSYEPSALVYFCSGVFPLVAVIILVISLVRKLIMAPAVKPAAHHHQQQPHSNQNAGQQYRQPTPRENQYQQHPGAAMHQREEASPTPRYIKSPGKEEPFDTNNNNNNNYNEYSVVEQKPQGNDGDVVQHPEGFELPEGDWVWDPASNMYWSESQYLFLNPQNSHFYDPNSNHWYNAETEAWYPAE